MTQIPDSSGDDPRNPQWSPSIDSMVQRFGGRGDVPAGEVIDHLLSGHPEYLDERIGWDAQLAELGPRRTVPDHLAVAATRDDPDRVTTLTGRHVILALALDGPEIGWSLLQSGVIASLLDLWTPGSGTDDEPHRLEWDVLSDEGRTLADDQPLLATAYGAPAEWTVEAPGPVTAVALSADSDRLVMQVGSVVYEAGADQDPRQIGDLGDLGDGIVSLGWSVRGPVALRLLEDAVELVQVANGASLGVATAVIGGKLSGDGSCAWLERNGAVMRWRPPLGPEPGTSSGVVLAVDGSGGRALVDTGSDAVLVSGLVDGPLPGSVEGQPDDPPGSAPAIGWGSPRGGPSALVTLGARSALVAISERRVVIEHLPYPPVARVATGAEPVTGLYVDPTGTRVAVVQGASVGVWGVSSRRAASTVVPSFAADDADTDDLLGADDDARALAALIASAELRPPLAVGLFGDWGAGKSFVLGRLTSALAAFTGPDAAEGYLRHVPVVEFNAWHYAETDLWSSLVERIRSALLPLAPTILTPDGSAAPTDAERRAAQVESQRDETARELTSANAAVDRARRQLRSQRVRAAVVVGLVLLMALAVALAVLLGAWGKVLAVAAFLGAAFGVVQQALRARREVAGAGAEAGSTLAHLVGQPEKAAVQAAEARQRHLLEQQQALAAEATRLGRQAEAAARDPLGAEISRLHTVTEYQARLGPIAHTRELFKKIDDEVRASRLRRRRGEQGDDETQLDRVVITIDDLDRCPPEKVVKVLEAIHLMCSFEMFVVLVAVDTRWLDQSLRIRYRELLGRKGTAAPKDYVEKIIQVPIQIPALGATQVQAMIAGLTGQAAAAGGEDGDPGTAGPQEGSGGHAAGPLLEAEHPRAPRPPLPAEVLSVGPEEGPALARVAPIVGTTPRTVKRFVNTYKLIKARSKDPSAFGDRDGDGLHDDEIVSFLLAVNTGHAALAQRLFGALRVAGEQETLSAVLNGLGADPERSDPSAELIRTWLDDHATYGSASASSLVRWVPEVARFSFVSPDRPPLPSG